MKLQRHKTRKDNDYYKYVVVIPEKTIKQAQLKEGDKLEADAEKNKIVLRKK